MQKYRRLPLSAICFAFSYLHCRYFRRESVESPSDVIQILEGNCASRLLSRRVMLDGGKVIHVDPWSPGRFLQAPAGRLDRDPSIRTADPSGRTMVDKLKKPEPILVAPPLSTIH